MTHTPGPWEVGYNLRDRTRIESVWADGKMIAHASRMFPKETTNANMIVMAQALNLLAANERALDAIYTQFPQYEYYTDEELAHRDEECYIVEVILQIRAAIAAATEQQKENT